jgi:hypothetical protein
MFQGMAITYDGTVALVAEPKGKARSCDRMLPVVLSLERSNGDGGATVHLKRGAQRRRHSPGDMLPDNILSLLEALQN